MKKVKNDISIPAIKAGKAITSFNLDELRQATLVQVLFGEPIEGARWLYALDASDSNGQKLQSLVAKLVRSFPDDIQGLCSAVSDDLGCLIARGNHLKSLAEKVIWDTFPKQAGKFERARLLSDLNVGEDCKWIAEQARLRGPNSVAEVAQKGWAQLAKLAETVAGLKVPQDVCMALNIMVGIEDLLVYNLYDWPRDIRDTQKWLDMLLAMPPDSASDGIPQNPSIKDILQAMSGLITKAVQEDGERTRNLVETESKKLQGRKRGLDGDNALVEAFQEMKHAVEVDKADAERAHRRPKGKVEIADPVIGECDLSIGTSRFLRLYEGQDGITPNWFQLGCPDTGEKYARAKAAAKKKRRKVKDG